VNGAAQNSRLLYFRALTVLMWAALPANAVLYAAWWNQLPQRMATHFNFANQPNGWMPREGSFGFAMFFATLLAVIATVILSRVKTPDAAAWGLLALFYVVEGTLLWAENSTIAYNTRGTPVNATPVFAVGIVAAVLLVVLALATHRGAKLSTIHVLARETHSSPAFAAVMALPTIGFALVIAIAPLGGVKLVLGLAMVLMLGGAAMAWSGFQYLFSPVGVEIRTLGFRLRSIPAGEIKSYAIDGWNLLRGYGIRGIGERRAYVWGNRGVRIKTFEGEVFLGHDEPEKIVHDLDLVMQDSHEGTQSKAASELS
jgi:Domain of unknown function (DUF1648)